MKKTWIALGMTAIMLLSVSSAFAVDHTGHAGDPGHSGTHHPESIGSAKGVEFTPEQKAQFKELRWKFEEETAQLKGSLLTKRLELRSLWRNPKTDPNAILEKEKELRDLQNQLRDKIVLFKLEARKFLTPEQIEKMGYGWKRGHGFGRRHMMGEGRGMGHEMGSGMGHEMGQGMKPGMGHGMGSGMGRGMGRGMGMCN